MKKIDILQIITVYKTFYMHTFKDYTESEIETMASLWLKKFERYSYDEMMAVADRLTSKSKYMPSIAEIIEELEILKNPVLQLNAEEEWNTVLQAIRHYGSYNPREAYDTFSEYTKMIVNRFGWNKICGSTKEELVWIKKEFISMFNDKQDGIQEALSVNEKSLTFTERQRIKEFNDEEERLMLEEFGSD